MSNITFWMVLQNLLLVVLVGAAYVCLSNCHPIFKWSWFSLFKKRGDANTDEAVEDDNTQGKNINLIPLEIKYFGLVYGVLLLVNLPSLAMSEEKMFRAVTHGWVEGIFLSLAFGMIHCLVGVPIGAGIAITIAGLWYTNQYFIGGVQLSALHHTTFNLICISILLIGLVLTHIADFKKDKTQEA